METQLKGVETRLERARGELKQRVDEKAKLDARIVTSRNMVRELEAELKRIKAAPVVIVSEHALLRYLERVTGIDMEEVKRKILTPDVVLAICHFHAGAIPHRDGFTMRVRENTITTIITSSAEAF